jgi:Flp pilus assembly protein TadG
MSGMPRVGVLSGFGDSLRRDERGASAVEFAIVAALLFLILFGIIEFGITFNRVQGLNSAGREGARSASIGAPIGDVVTRVQTAQSLFQQADVTVDIEYCVSSADCTVQANWTSVCTNCDSSSTTLPCTGSCVVGSLIRVSANVAKSSKYAIAIPLWSNWQLAYKGVGTFRVEKTS